MSSTTVRKQAPRPAKPVGRYWKGKAPKGAAELDSDSDADEDNNDALEPGDVDIAGDQDVGGTDEEEEEDMQLKSTIGRDTKIKAMNVTLRDVNISRDGKVIVAGREESGRTQMEESEEESEGEPQKEESEEESSEEEESSSEEEEQPKVQFRPVFVPKRNRGTIAERDALLNDTEEALKKKEQEVEERKKQSHDLVAESIRRELAEKQKEDEVPDVDDTDGLDPTAEFEAWRLRELGRIKKEKEEEVRREEERAEIERRRALPEEQRLKEDLERADKTRAEKPKGQQKFLQKYWHKGAFHQDAEILKRHDYTEATESTVDVSLLPKVMQVKNFGKRGRTKYTHLLDQDTTAGNGGFGGSGPVKTGGTSMEGGGCFLCGGPHLKKDCPQNQGPMPGRGPGGTGANATFKDKDSWRDRDDRPRDRDRDRDRGRDGPPNAQFDRRDRDREGRGGGRGRYDDDRYEKQRARYDEPRGGKRRIDDLLSISATILSQAEGPLSLVPIPGLSGLARALLKLVEMVQLAESLKSLTVLLETTSDNVHEQIKATSLINPQIAAVSLSRSQELSCRIKQLSNDIENVMMKGQELLRGSAVKRFLRGSDDSVTLQALDKEIQQAQSRFQLQGNVSIEMMINELISTTQTAELERQLGKLRTVDAGYRAPVNTQKSRWLEGTRTQLLQDIVEWSQGLGTDRLRANAPIFILTGGAGTGKSTIAVQVAKTLDEAGVLGGSFFFERGVEELSSTRYLFPTLATQLARMHQYLAPHIVRGIVKHQEKGNTQNLTYALDELLVEPLSEVPQGQWPPRPIIFVLDALDECSDQEQVPSMLYLLLKRIRSLSFPIRLFLTTRPEYHIQDAFTSLEWQSEPEPYQLMSIPMNIVRNDIKRFIDARLTDIGLDQKLKVIQDDAVEQLTDAANGLFIYASTCIEFLGRYKHDLRETLALVLNHAMNVDTLDALYDIVLSKAFSENDFRHPHLGPSIPLVLRALAVMQEQLLPVHFSLLLQLKIPVLNEVLDRMRSVLTYGADEPIRLLHASFPQYLVDPTRCRLPKINDSPSFSGHDYLASRCLEILLDRENLKRNICDLPDPLVHLNEITDLDERRARSISSSIEYACLHWSFHLCRSTLLCDTTKLFKDFMERKLLQWVEALGMIGRVDVVVTALNRLLEWYKASRTHHDFRCLTPH
ncbi:hypothetical protein ONZ45_g2592 [Pleurotus djamor]|nr:hypothetical protein ONZ45_g2592 [Pleurotus djamor]